ncbi:MAG: FAD-binding and (Fe-S)-binding domain-containing protein [Micromonosporaceae bacterium]
MTIAPNGAASGAPGARVDRSGLDEAARIALGAALGTALRGDVRFDSGARSEYSTDSSNYRQVPLGVIFPRDADDVAAALAVCAEHGAPVLGRGAGTSLAGQACNVGVVFEFSRHMRKIIDIDPERRTAVVQPGVVLDDLRDEARKHGLTFGPDPSTHAWCTLGGMIGNNSCGTHALYAGKTVDNVERLTVITYDGTVLDVGPTSDEELDQLKARPGRVGEIYRGLAQLRDQHSDQVRARYPDIPRRVSGYNLDELLPESGCNVARALVGSESTCAIVTEATLRLVPDPPIRRLVVLGFSDIFAAGDHVPALLRHGPIGLEAVDLRLTQLMRSQRLNLDSLELLPEGGGWLLFEFGGDDPDELETRVQALIADLPDGVSWRRADDPAVQKRMWGARESALGAAAHPPGHPPHLEGWEDAAVMPERVGDYMRRITALWDEYGYEGVWYGHIGQGCLHTRNTFDLRTESGLRDYRSYVERAADICLELGGSLSGEHGDGQARGELLTKMYGPELMDAFRQFKALWDPAGRMNPGKLIDAFGLDTNLRHGPDYAPKQLDGRTHFALRADHGSLAEAASRCVGVGRCRRFDTGVMCPSYRVTRDETHSTRGRAKLLEEMFRGEVTAADWRNDDVHEALDLCLSCKGCKVDCPTGVDMATYKAEFLSHYYAGKLRPRSAYALGLLPWAARLATRMPRLANAVTGSRLFRRLGGVTVDRPAPRFASKSLRRLLAGQARANDARGGVDGTRSVNGSRGQEATARGDVVLWPDTFTDAFLPDGGLAAKTVLESAGQTVTLPPRWACCGRTLYDFGMLDKAKSTLRRTLDALSPAIASGTPVVVLEPSCLAVFRDELPDLLADDPRAAQLAGLARSLPEHLIEIGAAIPRHPTGGQAVVQPHCHLRAIHAVNADRQVLEAMGFAVRILDAGCCGLAGSFGYRAEHAALSKQIAEQGVLPALAAADPGAVVVADGFSCAIQIGQLAGRRTQHLAELLAQAYATTPSS